MASSPHFRAAARRRFELPATMLILDDASTRYEALVTDLALGGARVELPASVSVGSQLTLEIKAPTLWDPLSLQAVVAWVGPESNDGIQRMGVRFTHHSPAALLALYDLLGAQEFCL